MNQLPSVQQYGKFAQFYDQLMNQNKYVGWNQLIKDVVDKYSIPPKMGLDIACGTGKVAGLLLKQGFAVVGIDKSNDMLKIARANYPEANFMKADIRDFYIERPDREKITLAVSFYDSFNYILSLNDMIKMFKSVATNIPDKTIFLFDMNTPEHISVSQNRPPQVFADDESFIIIRSSSQADLWKLDIDMFLKQPNGLFEHHQEQHTEKGYSETDIAPLLKKTGFNLLEVRPEHKVYENGEEHLSRIYFIARKEKSDIVRLS